MMRLASMRAFAGAAGLSGRRLTFELVGARLRRGEVEVAGVDRAAADHALDAFVLDRAQLLDVGQVATARPKR